MKIIFIAIFFDSLAAKTGRKRSESMYEVASSLLFDTINAIAISLSDMPVDKRLKYWFTINKKKHVILPIQLVQY